MVEGCRLYTPEELNSLRSKEPFADIEEHDQYLIDQWNSVVRPQDHVWVLGDVCFGLKNLPKIGLCNGTKRLIAGNHDMLPLAEYSKYFTRICGAVDYKGFIMTHIPVHESQFMRWTHNIHGHLHEKVLPDKRYINVSVEQLDDMKPISLAQLYNKVYESY